MLRSVGINESAVEEKIRNNLLFNDPPTLTSSLARLRSSAVALTTEVMPSLTSDS